MSTFEKASLTFCDFESECYLEILSEIADPSAGRVVIVGNDAALSHVPARISQSLGGRITVLRTETPDDRFEECAGKADDAERLAAALHSLTGPRALSRPFHRTTCAAADSS
jgi:hypothetical protein